MKANALAAELAEWVASVSSGEIPSSARHAARRVLLDQTGVGFAGSAHAAACATEGPSHQNAAPRATCWACGVHCFAPDAVLANRRRGDHLELAAGPEYVAASLAAAEIADATVGALVEALAVAADVDDYLRRLLQSGAERHGLHPPALLGSAASAAAAGRLLGLNRSCLAGALSAALALAPCSPYIALSTGASGKALYGAWGQMLGLQAALWADTGMGGPVSVIEGERGLMHALRNGSATSPPPSFVAGRWAIERVAFKAFPCNRTCHAPLTALEHLGPLDTQTIRRITVWTYPFAVDLDRRTSGDTSVSAQVSIKRTLALRLHLGEITPDSYALASIANPAVVDLARRTTVEVHPDTVSGERIRLARVRIECDDGEVREAECQAQWGPEAPASDEDLRNRFLRLTRGVPSVDFWKRGRHERVRTVMDTLGTEHTHG